MSTVAVAAQQQQHPTDSRTHSLTLAADSPPSAGAVSVENGQSAGMPCTPCPSSNGSSSLSAESSPTVPGCGGVSVGNSSSTGGHTMVDGQTDTSVPSGGGDGQQQPQQDQPPGSRPTSGGRQQRIAGGKGKHLTRSHAMRESTSPPRTPTPRSPSDTHSSNPISSAGNSGSTGGLTNSTTAVTTSTVTSSSNNALSNGPQCQPERSTTSSSTMNDTESLAKHNSSGPGGGGTGGGGTGGNGGSPNIVHFSGGGDDQQRNGKSQLDLDFPKLTPPKTSFNPNAGSNGNHHSHSQKSGAQKSNGTATHHGKANGTVTETDKAAPLMATGGNSNGAKQTATTPSLNVTSTVSPNATTTGTDTPDGGGTTRPSPSNHSLVPVSSTSANVVVSSEVTTVGGDPNTGAVGSTTPSTYASPVVVQSAANSNYCDSEGRHGSYQQHHQHHHHQQHQYDAATAGGAANADGQINIQFSHETETRYIQCDSPTDSLMRSGGGGGGAGPTTTPPSGGSKKRSGASGKGANKATRLKNLSGGSSSSVDGGMGGGGGGGGGMASFMSRDSLCDPFTDQSGINLIQFFKETLNKNFKDRNMLMKIEKELLSLAMDRSRSQMKFPPMSSYNRMLIHRVAAYFGMEHNVDSSQQSVIAEVTPATRIPDVRFKNLISDSFSEEPRKSILKRDTHSFDEYHRFGGSSGVGGGGGGGGGGAGGSGLLHCPTDRGMLDRKAKSFEEREEEYEKSKRRLFKNREHDSESDQWPWISTDGGGGVAGGAGVGTTLADLHAARHQQKLQNNRLLKVQSVSIEGRSDERPCVSKSHSFGGYGGSSQNASLLRGDSITSTKSAGARLFTKQDSNASTNTPWRLSPSSSGYKTQSIRSDSVTPSPTGYGSGDHTPEPCVPSPSTATCGVMWAVTDMASVPKGSVLIDPQTFQPIVNQDGSLYHFDPSNLPPTAGGPWSGNGKMSKRKFEKQKSFNSKNNLNSSSSLESSVDGPALGKTMDCGQQTTIPTVGDGPGAITTIMTVVSTAATTTPTTIAEEVVNELGCYDAGVTTGGLKLLSVKDNPDMDENLSLCEEISQTTNELGALKLQKHQATSPMLQASELQPIDMNEIQYGTNQNDGGNLVHTANAAALLDNDRSLIDDSVETVGEEQDDLGDSLDAMDKPDHNNPALGAAVQLLHVHDPVSSSSTLDAADDDEDRSETPTDGGPEETDKKNDMVKVANVVQTVVPLTSYTSATATPNGGNSVGGVGGGGGGGVSAYTVTYDGGGSGHPGATVYATGTPGLSTTTYQTAPDGAIYAVPSSLVYTYPTTMDPTEMSGGYFVPVYDPQQQREASLCSTPGASIYSAPAGATSTVLHPIAYTQSAAAAAAAAAAAYTGAPLYQNPVMYSSDQFPAAQAAAAAAAAGQLSQYPISYPIGIGYPFNGAAYQNYWNQPITYYVPQTPVPSTVGGVLMQPPIAQTPTNGGIMTTTATSTPGPGNSTAGAPPLSGKRNTTPPNSGHGQSQSGATHSASVTPVPISPFTANLPVPLPDSSSAAAGAPMYAAFPQPLYPNMLPFASPMATHPHPVAAPAGTLVPTAASFHPHPSAGGSQHHHTSAHHHHHHPGSSTGGGVHGESTSLPGGNSHQHHSQYHHPQQQQPHHQQQAGHYSSANGPSNGGGNSSSSSSSSNSSHSGGNHSNNCATNAPTPQSTPSTPLSLPMSMPAHHGGVPGGTTHKGMPLFPTPPIMSAGGGGGGYGGHHHYASSEERKTGNGGGYQGSKPRQPNPNSGGSSGGSYFNYNASANGGRQMTPNSSGGSGSYQPPGGGMKGGYAHNNTGNNNQNGPLILGPPPPGKGNRHEGSAPQSVSNANSNASSNSKPPLIPTLPSMVVAGAAAPNTGIAGDKSRLNRSSKPPNLDLKRSYSTNNSYSGVVNNRNTPSTNSNESNGSPNSITSSSVHEHGHVPASHHPMAHGHAASSHHHGGAGGHGGSNHPSPPTAHHHGGSGHPVVSAGGQQSSQHGGNLHHHHPHAQHHPHHGGGSQQSMPPGVGQQHGGPGGGGGGTTHYYHPGGGQSMAGGQPHSGQSSYYASGANGPSQRGGSVGSNNGGGGGGSGAGSGSGAGNGGAHPHAMPAAVMHNSAVAAAAAAAAVEPYHQQLIPINAATGMSYVKIGQAYYPSLTLPQSRRSPPNEIRPIAGVYPTMNMVMPASRQFTPRPQHSSGYSNAKATKSLR
ncbi:protein encore isoform X2 [Anopheles stephensi]|uniref:protein encore isoform X2 n=1 Tax=Anopheles stephensi TaxID=30069 RepID=UPI001658886A|nr:protein encore isoform X2 [Anopheles stephensi]